MVLLHGTRSKYSGGCRCDECRIANTVTQRAIRDHLSAKPFDEIPHGTANAYSNYRCRCPECAEVGAAINQKNARRRRARVDSSGVPEGVPHGKVNTYSTWSCRCPECRAAWAKRQRDTRARAKGTVWAKSQPIKS